MIALAGAGASARASAARFGVRVSTAIVGIRHARQDSERSTRRQGKPRGTCLDPHEAFIIATIGEAKDITLNEMAAKLRAEQGLQIGRSALSAWLGGRLDVQKKSASRNALTS